MINFVYTSYIHFPPRENGYKKRKIRVKENNTHKHFRKHKDTKRAPVIYHRTFHYNGRVQKM